MKLHLSPVEGDPGAPAAEVFIGGADFLPCVSGDITAVAVDVALFGGGSVRAVAVEIPVETDQGPKAARILLSVDTARVLTDSVGHVDRWIRSHE